MAELNKWMGIGNLCRDPELRYTPDGDAVCTFEIASNRVTGRAGEERKEDVLFIRIVAWKKLAEQCAEMLKKGRQVLVEGRLKENRWEDRKTGQKRSRIECVAAQIQFLGGGHTPDERAPAEQSAG